MTTDQSPSSPLDEDSAFRHSVDRANQGFGEAPNLVLHTHSSLATLHPAAPTDFNDSEQFPNTAVATRDSWVRRSNRDWIEYVEEPLDHADTTQHLGGLALASLMVGLTLAAFLLMIDSTILVTVSPAHPASTNIKVTISVR